MNTNQIDRILSQDNFSKNHFVGTFSWNNVPLLDKYASCIVNSDCEDYSGQHWLAYFYGECGLEFFDSFANIPSFYPGLPAKVDVLNRKRVQGFDSQMCGQWCVYFLLNRYRRYTMNDIVRRFGNDYDANDHWIRTFFFEYFGIDTSVHIT